MGYYPPLGDDGPKLKDPDVFSGKDPSRLTPFLTQCIQWFIAHPRKFSTSRAKVVFASSYLRDLAASWWMPILAQHPPSPILDDWDAFAEELFQMFGDQHLQASAQNALLGLKMKDNTRVSEYLVTFNSHAPYTGWNDTALAGQFYRGLPDRLKDAFQVLGRPQDFVTTCQQALQFDQRYWERQAESGIRPSSTFRSKDKNRSDQGSKSSDSKSNTNNSQSSSSSNSQRSDNKKKSSDGTSASSSSKKGKESETPSQGSGSTSQPRGPLSAEEKERRRRDKLCLYCASPDHRVDTCPVRAKSPKATGRATYTFTPEDESKNSSPTQESEVHS
jgi:Retrotransposon gag protein